ncbi:MAG TPA: hypothetical protein DD412_05205 [Holosporales bacterium]|nr:hypothetical protein [Holosporales bacterium]
MTRHMFLTHEFVEFIPDELEEGTLYICVKLATVVHRCCCGCGNEVVTPLTPTDWKLTYDGETITLYPSIGNWGSTCSSHYWIVNNRAMWARQWSQEQIEASRALDRSEKERYFGGSEETDSLEMSTKKQEMPQSTPMKKSFWERLRKFWG